MTDSRRHTRALSTTLFFFVFVLVGWLGVTSVDFGVHWDENKLIGSLQDTARGGEWIPRWYHYPSMCYDIGMLVVVGSALRDRTLNRSEGLGGYLPRIAGDGRFRHDLRRVFFLLSSLAGLGTYLLARRLTGCSWSALFAGSLLLSSWEYMYHSRWVAPDAILATIVIWTLLAQQILREKRSSSSRRGWVVIASVLAGMCIGTKYPGGIVVLPMIVAIEGWPRHVPCEQASRRHQGHFGDLVLAALVTACSFLLITPGLVVQPLQFLQDVLSEVSHYRRGHGGYTVAPGFDHLSKILGYLVFCGFSKFSALAICYFMLVLLGTGALLHRRNDDALWLLVLPVAYLAYMSSQRVMIVRNYLLVLPVLAVLAGVGVQVLVNCSRRLLRQVLPSMAVVGIVVGLWVFACASRRIEHRICADPGGALIAWLRNQPDEKFCLSPQARRLIQDRLLVAPVNVSNDPAHASHFVYLSTEVVERSLLPANTFGRYRTVWSAFDDVNWDYYPTWVGSLRILDVSTDDASVKGLILRAMRSDQEQIQP